MYSRGCTKFTDTCTKINLTRNHKSRICQKVNTHANMIIKVAKILQCEKAMGDGEREYCSRKAMLKWYPKSQSNKFEEIHSFRRGMNGFVKGIKDFRSLRLFQIAVQSSHLLQTAFVVRMEPHQDQGGLQSLINNLLESSVKLKYPTSISSP